MVHGGKMRVDDAKVYEEYLTFPDGFVVHLMVLQESTGHRRKSRTPRQPVYRSRIWIGVQTEEDPRIHRSQEHTNLQEAVDACWRMLRDSALRAMKSSPAAIRQATDATGAYFCAEPQSMDA